MNGKLALHRWVTRKDLRFLAEVGLGYWIAALCPRRWDPWIVDRWVNWYAPADGGAVRDLAGLMRALLGPAAGQRDLLELAARHYRTVVEDRWGHIRDLHKQGWTPEIAVEGIRHIQEGLKASRGVILWGMHFCGGAVAKAGLAAAGIRLAHLSREHHGRPSRSWLGERLAYFGYKPELRYLDRRIVIPGDESLGYMRELIGLLASNACLSITGELPGRQSVEAEFFGGREKFATGAPGLAYKMGSPLLTYYAVREGTFRYRVVIEGPIEADRGVARQQFVRAAVEQFAERLQRTIVAHPSDWYRWYYDWWRRLPR